MARRTDAPADDSLLAAKFGCEDGRRLPETVTVQQIQRAIAAQLEHALLPGSATRSAGTVMYQCALTRQLAQCLGFLEWWGRRLVDTRWDLDRRGYR